MTFFKLLLPLCLFMISCATDQSQMNLECGEIKSFSPTNSKTLDPKELQNIKHQIETNPLPQAKVQVLDSTMQQMLTKAPGLSVALSIQGEGHWFAQQGFSNYESKIILDSTQKFQIASITKTFTTAIILQLIDENKIHLKDKLIQWIESNPELPNTKSITIENLLRHTNGLISFNALNSFPKEYLSPQQSIELVAQEPALFCPGTSWNYTNTGYTLLGLIIEKIEGKPLAKVIENRITKPLKLSNTVLRTYGDSIKIVNGHDGLQKVQVEDDYATAYAAGSIASNAQELIIYWNAFLTGQLFDASNLAYLFSNTIPMNEEFTLFYGAGVQLYEVPNGPGLMLGHSGGIPGFTSVLAYLPEDQIFISVLVNDKAVPAEAVLWAFIQTLRAYK